MYGSHTWSNIGFTFSAELYCYDGKIYDSDNDQEVDLGCDIPLTEESDATFELVIEGTSSGYYDPGRTYGPPEKCYPPEGEDERTFDCIYVLQHNDIQGVKSRIKHDIPAQRKEDLFEQFCEQIQDIELDTQGD